MNHEGCPVVGTFTLVFFPDPGSHEIHQMVTVTVGDPHGYHRDLLGFDQCGHFGHLEQWAGTQGPRDPIGSHDRSMEIHGFYELLNDMMRMKFLLGL